MTSNTKGVIAVGVTLGLVGLVYYFFVRSKKDENRGGGISSSENLEAVKKNLGGKFEKDTATVKFNDAKNKATFYTNDRVIIFDDKDKVIMRGNYSDGGKKINIEKGKQVADDSVWTNLALLVK
jgi:hypothetical protein